MTLAARALAQLAAWPDLSEAEPSCGVGRALRAADGEIVHFRSDDHVDRCLTARAIKRFEEHLTAAHDAGQPRPPGASGVAGSRRRSASAVQ
ncbi:luciferase family protein [Streptomyces chartreusis]|uniref:luciferase family protein n=1 Tax=Streptomyces chartreusis TaxID=1969 RepID=UPI00382D6AF1